MDIEEEYFINLDCSDIISNKYSISNYGTIYINKTNKEVKQQERDEYMRAHLMTNDGYKLFSINRLVMIMFGNDEILFADRTQVNHNDGNKKNNYYKNLEWATNQENVIHAIKNGLKTFDSIRGEKNYNVVLTENEVHTICKLLEAGITNSRQLCDEIKKPHSNNLKAIIYNIKIGRNWKHISRNYDIDKYRKK